MSEEPVSVVADANYRDAPEYRLKLLSGLHAGAERECREGDMLIVGTHAECDLILSDQDVAERHCVVGFARSGLVVRPIATGVQFNDLPLTRGQTHTIPFFHPVRIGNVDVIAGPADDPVWHERYAVPASAHPAIARRTLWKQGAGLPIAATALAAIALFTAIALSASTREVVELAVSPREALVDIIESLELTEVRVENDDNRSLRVTGIVPETAALQQLRQRSKTLDPSIDIQARSGEDVAKDVREVMRMQGLLCQTQYLGNGVVRVTGYFPDEALLSAALESPHFGKIAGLNKIVEENLVEAAAPEAPPVEEKFKPYSIVPDPEPYVIGPDASRYYVGAKIPTLGKLIEIDGQTLYIDTGYSTRIYRTN